ncbi:MAG: hypothetical protein CBC01_03510 [Betaproteobacteria bacterium TMED41]|nr:MAG: hypothetical protein CBC01_03510 [Betaproteobacteria bacterium TMED41]|tara:strand:+ start:208 stop:723 length:516 start_codon:yes stop_codon:yes gene_type:complete
MHEYHIHTLVDITSNGNLKRQFPFQTPDGKEIHDKHSLAMARDQNSNFNTMLQLIQMRGNITWEQPPQMIELPTLGNHGFGSYYEGPQLSWHFQFFTEQSGVYGDIANPTESLADDFNLVPIIAECKNTASFPIQTFVTKELQGTDEQKVIDALAGGVINTYFSYSGPIDK